MTSFRPQIGAAFQKVDEGGLSPFAFFPVLTQEEQDALAALKEEDILGLGWELESLAQIMRHKNQFIEKSNQFFCQYHGCELERKNLQAGELAQAKAHLFEQVASFQSSTTRVMDVVLPIAARIATRLRQSGEKQPPTGIYLRFWDSDMYSYFDDNEARISSWHRDYLPQNSPVTRRVIVTLRGEPTHFSSLKNEAHQQETASLLGRVNKECTKEKSDLDAIVSRLLEKASKQVTNDQPQIVSPKPGEGAIFLIGEKGAIHRIPPIECTGGRKRIILAFDFAFPQTALKGEVV